MMRVIILPGLKSTFVALVIHFPRFSVVTWVYYQYYCDLMYYTNIRVFRHSLKGAVMAYSIRLPEDIEERLENLAAQTGRSKKFYVVRAIEHQLNDIENIYLSEKRLEDVRAGNSKTFTLDEVERDLGLVG